MPAIPTTHSATSVGDRLAVSVTACGRRPLLPSLATLAPLVARWLLVAVVAGVPLAGCGGGETVTDDGEREPTEHFGDRPVAHTDDVGSVAYTWRDDVPEYVRQPTPIATAVRIRANRPIALVMLNDREIARPERAEAQFPVTLEPVAGRPSGEWGAPTHTIAVYAEADAAGPIGAPFSEYGFRLLYDAQPPAVSIDTPSWPGEGPLRVVADMVEITWSAEDDIGLAAAWLQSGDRRFDAPTRTPDGVSASTTSRIRLPVREGEQTLTLGARDVAGRETVRTWVVARDSVPPMLRLDGRPLQPGKNPPPILTREATVTLRIAAVDPSGVAAVTLGGNPLVAPAGGSEYVAELRDLGELENRFRLVAVDRLGNTVSVWLTVVYDPRNRIIGTADVSVELPPFPFATFGITQAPVSFAGPARSPQEVVRRLQIDALAHALATRYTGLDAALLARSPLLQREAAQVYLRLDRWEADERAGTVTAEAMALLSESLLISLATRAAEFASAGGEPRDLLGEAVAEFTLATTRTIDAAAVAVDEEHALFAAREPGDGTVEVWLVALADGAVPVTARSALRWHRVTRMRTVPGHAAVVLMGTARGTEATQMEWLPMDGGAPRTLPAGDGRLAWHPREAVAVAADPATGDWRRLALPEWEARPLGDRAPQGPGTAAGFVENGAALVAVGVHPDAFGVGMPGTLLVLDPASGAVRGAFGHQDALLARLAGFEPATAVAEASARVAALQQAFGARVAQAGHVALLTSPRAALAIDVSSGAALGAPFPTPHEAAMLGGTLQFQLDPTGHTAAVHGQHGTLVYDVASGLPVVQVPHAFWLAEQAAYGFEAEPVGGGGGVRVTATRLPRAPRELSPPQGNDARRLSRGDRLRLAVVSVEGQAIDDEVRARLGEVLHRAAIAGGFRLVQEPADDDNGSGSGDSGDGAGAGDAAAAAAGDESAGRIICETWVREAELALRITLAVGTDTPGRYLLGEWQIDLGPQRGTPTAALQEIARRMAARLPVLPARLFNLAHAAHDLPRHIRPYEE